MQSCVFLLVLLFPLLKFEFISCAYDATTKTSVMLVGCHVNIKIFSSCEKSRFYVWSVGRKNPEFAPEFDVFTSLLLSKQPEWQMFHSICHIETRYRVCTTTYKYTQVTIDSTYGRFYFGTVLLEPDWNGNSENFNALQLRANT